jgi:SAM-dependent methyltransferase
MSERKGGDFTGLSQIYQRHRPDYPPEITAACVAFLEAGGRTRDFQLLAVDVGAGTGISTRAWRRALGDACRVVGIEPSQDMCREAVASTPANQRIEYLIGTAEALPIATSQAGLIAAAQAAHWFDRSRFYAEARRALGPAGVVAIMANNRDWAASTFLDRYEALLEAHSPDYCREHLRIDFTDELTRLPWVEASSTRQHRWARRLAPEALPGLLLSSSLAQRAVAAIGEDHFLAAVRETVAEAVEPDGLVTYPYVAEIHLARKRRA